MEQENNNNDIFDIVKKIDDNTWEVPKEYKPFMRVPGKIFVSENMLRSMERETIDQVANVSALPGIQKHSLAMPDAHLGYGFPIGGVAAFDSEEGVISPGGVGFDINCGVRLIRTNLHVDEVRPVISELIKNIFQEIPSGLGSKSRIRVNDNELDNVFLQGARWAVEQGYGVESDVEHCEGNGMIEGADPSQVSSKARKRGKPQLGTLGSGNHFLEIQYIDNVYDEKAAQAYGLEEGQVTFMVHCGSRGAGHQICTDHLRTLSQSVNKYGIQLPDKQLACAPTTSPEAQNYFKAMACAANYAWANRQIIMHWTREVFAKTFKTDIDSLEMDLVYDVAHNIAKLEEHIVDGTKKKLYVHRKGATRAFPPGHSEVPQQYRAIGQPVLLPGSMGTPSFVLHGTQQGMDTTFGSACHGSGRAMSRKKAKGAYKGEDVKRNLAAMGIHVEAMNPAVIAEEAPEVYKKSSDVVNVVHDSGIAQKVVRMVPMGVAKG
ncbi:RtcB family protein [Methanosalsum natronophilum]|uniref:tRNA-splicing ligase RtcB n=1 Tax=Methanosalsum natronophilum TaxID=768733 RepID=A0A424YXZ5_9EURY|nr:RtcB family protein [Methanosalsum natronophilum]MCS3923724.1 tRNA-splicing ligase RtcB [Methanosalsum natronophilum]RQD85357.1 MAG: RtcB family protein [Methanosalsum natronophilum]